MNPASFLKNLERIITGHGFKKQTPISLYDFHLDDGFAELGVPSGDEPGFVKENDHLTIQWPATKVAAVNVQFILPDDYDESNDHLKLLLKACMDGSTDTTTALEGAAYADDAETTDLEPDNTADLTTTSTWVEFDLSDNSLSAGDVISIDINPEAHGTDVVEIWGAKLEYKSDLVYFDLDSR